MHTALLEVRNLQLHYNNNHILHDINFKIAPQKIIGIAGLSGCGKSSLLKAIAGILPSNAAVSGALNWQGQNLLTDKALHNKLRGKDITMLLQNPAASLHPITKISDQFCDMLRSNNLNKQDILEKAAQSLAALNIANPAEILSGYPFQLSGGTNQRVALAMLLLQQPKLLLADEPTSGLDVAAQLEALKELRELKLRANTAMLIVSHNIVFLENIADKILIMRQGRLTDEIQGINL